MPKPVLFRNRTLLMKSSNIVGLGLFKMSRHHGLANKMKQMKISGGAVPVRRIEQISGGRINRRPISFMP